MKVAAFLCFCFQNLQGKKKTLQVAHVPTTNTRRISL